MTTTYTTRARLLERIRQRDRLEVPLAFGPGELVLLSFQTGERYDGLDLSELDAPGAVLCRADLRHARLAHAQLTDADLAGAELAGANFERAQLAGASLRHVGLEAACFHRASLGEAVIVGHCEGADFTEAVCHRTYFGGHFREASFRGADLRGARFGLDCDLTLADFTEADLRGAHLLDVDLSQATLTGIRVDAETTMGEGELSRLAREERRLSEVARAAILEVQAIWDELDLQIAAERLLSGEPEDEDEGQVRDEGKGRPHD